MYHLSASSAPDPAGPPPTLGRTLGAPPLSIYMYTCIYIYIYIHTYIYIYIYIVLFIYLASYLLHMIMFNKSYIRDRDRCSCAQSPY